MKHFVLINEWEFDGDSEVELVGVFHTEEELKEAFEARREEELDFIYSNGLIVDTDTEEPFCLRAFEEGNYNSSHTNLFVLTEEAN